MTTREQLLPTVTGARGGSGLRAARATGRKVPAGTWLVLPAVVLCVAVLAGGLATALAQSLGLLPLAGGARLSSRAWDGVLTSSTFLDGLAVSLGIATASTVLAVGNGMLIATVVLRSRIGGRLVAALAASTLPVPHLVGATAIGLLLADSGLVARLVGAEPGTFPALVGGPWWPAVVAEYAWKESAFVAVVVLGAVASTERHLDEAAAVLGAGPAQRFRRVTLPLAGPSLVVAGTIAFAYVLGAYEVPWLLGRTYPEPLPVLAFRLFSGTDLAARPEAMAVALTTVGVAGAALAVGASLLRRVTARR